MSYPALSAIVLTQNVAGMIRNCLESLRFADEIFVVDANSTDGTDEIARSLGAVVVSNPWPGFAAQRRFAMERCRGRWIFMCDSDEVATAELGAEIRGVVDGAPPEDGAAAEGSGAKAPGGFRVRRRNHYMGRWIQHGPWARDTQLRLFRRDAGRMSEQAVHEGIVVDGPVGILEAPLLHFTHHTLSDSIERINRYTTLEASDRANRRRIGPLDPLFPPMGVFMNYYLRHACWRDGMPGLFLSATTAMYKSLLYIKIYALQRGIGPQPRR